MPSKKYPILGAHLSVAGGYYKALERAAALDMATCQIFTKNNNQWRAREITDEEAVRFRDTLAELKIVHPAAHASYLINLASPDAALWKRSVEAMVVELEPAEQLGIPFVVVHPGAFTTSDEASGLKNLVRAVNEIHQQTENLSANCLLENTAGQGSCLGWRFEHLAEVLQQVDQPEQVGWCFDTCHAFAAGYPLSKLADYRRTMRRFNRLAGLDKIKAIHLNDSKRDLGSRVDRHEHIGQGALGLEAFGHLLRDRRLRKVPMYLETPKGEHNGREWDAINLETLRGLVDW